MLKKLWGEQALALEQRLLPGLPIAKQFTEQILRRFKKVVGSKASCGLCFFVGSINSCKVYDVLGGLLTGFCSLPCIDLRSVVVE